MRRSASPSSVGPRWRSYVNGRPQPDEVTAAMWGAIRSAQPRFFIAVAADARVVAAKRGERSPFPSRFATVVQVVRLMLVTDAFLAQVCYRAKVDLQGRGIPLVPRLLHRVAISQGQICIGDPVLVEPGVYFPHGQVVIDGLTTVRSGAVISPFVTLGRRGDDVLGPTIGHHALIGTGAKVIGPVTVGDHANVGANAVVLTDVPAHATAVGVPARATRSTTN